MDFSLCAATIDDVDDDDDGMSFVPSSLLSLSTTSLVPTFVALLPSPSIPAAVLTANDDDGDNFFVVRFGFAFKNPFLNWKEEVVVVVVVVVVVLVVDFDFAIIIFLAVAVVDVLEYPPIRSFWDSTSSSNNASSSNRFDIRSYSSSDRVGEFVADACIPDDSN
jgi:membrane protein implicated in regulation of membrane protease activity